MILTLKINIIKHYLIYVYIIKLYQNNGFAMMLIIKIKMVILKQCYWHSKILIFQNIYIIIHN